MSTYVDFSELKGKVITGFSGEAGDDAIQIDCSDGSRYDLYHEQDCCEHVRIEDIIGDVKDLIGNPLLEAEEISNADGPEVMDYGDDSHTWTFYKLATIKGAVTIRWLGESNGYYGEGVSVYRTIDPTKP